jgi:hypothetical protein
MTLIQRMRQELIRRNYSATTIRSYTKAVEHFQGYVGTPLDQLGPDDLRSYHAYLLGDRKLAVNTVVLNVCAQSASLRQRSSERAARAASRLPAIRWRRNRTRR